MANKEKKKYSFSEYETEHPPSIVREFMSLTFLTIKKHCSEWSYLFSLDFPPAVDNKVSQYISVFLPFSQASNVETTLKQ